MMNQNPYESPTDADRRPTTPNRDYTIILAIVLVDVAFSSCKFFQNRTNTSPPFGIGAVFVLWIMVELVAVRLIWRGHAAGRWILVASFGLRGIGQIGLVASWLLMMVRTPSIALAGRWLYYLVQAICCCAATFWLLFIARFENHAAGESLTL